jgi:hypothetical protein
LICLTIALYIFSCLLFFQLPASIPLLVLHGTDNGFVLPKHASDIAQYRGENVLTVNSPEELMIVGLNSDRPAVHVSWLQAGHELLQERGSFVLQLIPKMTQLAIKKMRCIITDVVDHGSDRRRGSFSQGLEDRLDQLDADFDAAEQNGDLGNLGNPNNDHGGGYDDVLNVGGEGIKNGNLAEGGDAMDDLDDEIGSPEELAKLVDSVETDFVKDLIVTEGIWGVRTELKNRRVADYAESKALSIQEIVQVLDHTILREINEDGEQAKQKLLKTQKESAQDAKRTRRATELEARQKRSEEAKRRAEAKKRRAELQKIREEKARQDEIERIETELAGMEEEDAFGEQMREDMYAQKQWELEAEHALKITKELDDFRNEDDDMMEKEEEGLVRAARHEARRERLKLLRRKLELDEVTLEGEEATQKGLDPENNDVDVVQVAGDKLCKDMLEIRERKMTVMRRQIQSTGKFEMYQKQKETCETNVLDIRRALQRAKKEKDAAVTNTALRQRANAREITEMSKKRDELETQLADISEYFNGAREELESSNGSVQRVTVVMEQKEAELKLLATKVEGMLDKRTMTILTCREKETFSLTRKKTLANDLETNSIRLEIVLKEEERAAKWTEGLIDSSVYQGGILQRLRTKDLRQYLGTEKESLKEKIILDQDEVIELEGIVVELGKIMDIASEEASNLRQIQINIESVIQVLVTQSLKDNLEQMMSDDQEDARKKLLEATEKEKEDKLIKQGFVTLASRVRHKSHDERSKDEKRWVALDVLINHEEYLHVSELEAEEMKYDEEYKTTLTAEDVQRLLVLPPFVQLALPFLRSAAEIAAYVALQHFTFERGKQKQIDADLKSCDEAILRDEEEKDAIELEGRAKLEGLLHTRKIERLRTATPEDLNELEHYWVCCDRLLNPEFYAVEEVEQEKVEETNVKKTLTVRERKQQALQRAKELEEIRAGTFVEKKDEVAVVQTGKGEEFHWECPLSREELLLVGTALSADVLETDEQRHAWQVMKMFEPSDLAKKNLSNNVKVANKGTVTTTYRVVDSLAMVPAAVSNKLGNPRLPGRIVLVNEHFTENLLNVREQILDARESRTFSFDIPKEKFCIDITVSIVFQGVFGPQGYSLGRLAAMLYKLPTTVEQSMDEDGVVNKSVSKGLPKPCGYAPVERLQLCSTAEFGRTTIVHRPATIPLSKDYTYQVVVGCPTKTKFSVEVSCRLVEDAEVVVEHKVKETKKWQSRHPKCNKEIYDLKESMRLGERKLRLVEQKTTESEKEIHTVEKEMKRLSDLLEEDERTLALNDNERLGMLDKIQHMEGDFTKWCTVFTSRKQEIADIKEGLEKMGTLYRKRQDEGKQLEKDIMWARENIPTAAAALLGDQAGVHVANEIQAVYSKEQSTAARWAGAKALTTVMASAMSPAQHVRNKAQKGEVALTNEEERWCALDRVLNQEKWEWEEAAALKQEKIDQKNAILREAGLLKDDESTIKPKSGDDNTEETKDDPEDTKEGADGSPSTSSKSKSPKKPKSKPSMTKTAKRNALAIPDLSRQEIQRILDTPWHALERKEVLMRKLLNKFHDRSEADGTGTGSVLSLDNDSVPYDPKLAMMARAKPKKDLTDQERQWICLDEKMNPDMHAKASRDALKFDFSKGDHKLKKMKALEKKEHEERMKNSLDEGVLAPMPGTVANSTGWYCYSLLNSLLLY